MTEQVGGGGRESLFALSLEAARPPSSSASQLIARCFITSASVRITAGIFPCAARLFSSHATKIGTFSRTPSLFAGPRGYALAQFTRLYPLIISDRGRLTVRTVWYLSAACPLRRFSDLRLVACARTTVTGVPRSSGSNRELSRRTYGTPVASPILDSTRGAATDGGRAPRRTRIILSVTRTQGGDLVRESVYVVVTVYREEACGDLPERAAGEVQRPTDRPRRRDLSPRLGLDTRLREKMIPRWISNLRVCPS